MTRVVVVPLGGPLFEEAMEAVLEQAREIARIAEDGAPLVLVPLRCGLLDSHLSVLDLARSRRAELTDEYVREFVQEALPDAPLDLMVAEVQAALGYIVQQAVEREFKVRGIGRPTCTVLTQVVVDIGDPSFLSPTQRVGGFLDEETARLRRDEDGWLVAREGDNWRRVVASPQPLDVVELDVIRAILDAGIVVVAGAGGGIPVVKDERGLLMGVAAVIDESATAKLLADRLGGEVVML